MKLMHDICTDNFMVFTSKSTLVLFELLSLSLSLLILEICCRRTTVNSVHLIRNGVNLVYTPRNIGL